MKKRLLYGAYILALAVLVTLVVWQGSFSFGDYGPGNSVQTSLYWAVSSLVFLLTLTIGFMLFRTGVKLYIERRSNREGSRIRTKLVIGALTLSFLPVFFLVLWSVYVLNRNLDKWFSRPAEGIRQELTEVAKALSEEMQDKARLQGELLAGRPEVRQLLARGERNPSFFEKFCSQHGVAGAHLLLADGRQETLCAASAGAGEVVSAEVPVPDSAARLALKVRTPLDMARKQGSISRWLAEYDDSILTRKTTRSFYLQLLFLLTLFILFIATWLALYLARQISIPISALLEGASQVRKGNWGHRVEVQAIDELATLVRSFNQMTETLETSRRELEARRRLIEAILESIPTGVISVAPDGRILRVNAALSHILPREAVSRAEKLEDLFSREDLAEIKYLMKRARRTGLASTQMEHKTERQTLQLSLTVSALETKMTSGFVLVLEDTSELLRAQKSAAWHEVARRIAHEIKNPLTPIALSAERILRHLERSSVAPASSALLAQCAATIVQEVESLKTLVGEFSQFARFPAAKPAPSDLNEIVESALAVFAGRLDGIQLTKELAPHLPLVNVDREQLKRAVVNLVDNAAEAMQHSLVKRLYVATMMAGESVELIVADTGCGLTAEEKEKLFLPYFSTKGRGTGLGLAIVSHILAEHNAHIRAEDNFPAGARFVIEIPVPAHAEPETKPAEARI